MKQIIKNEWFSLSRNKAFLGISLVFILTLFLSIALGHQQTKQLTNQYEKAQEQVREQWENLDAMNPHRAAHFGTYVFKPTNLLSSLDEGVNSVVGNVLRVEGHVQNEIVYSEASQMESVSKFGKLKSSLLLQYILPLLLVFLAFQSVSSEKKSGRLKILLLQGASPSSLVWAKTLSIWLFGIAMLTLTILLYALFNSGGINVEILQRTGLFFLAYGLYYFILCGITTFLSTHWNNTTLALTTMLGLWILWTIFLPNILWSSIENRNDLPSRHAFQQSMKEDRSKGIDGHNPADARAVTLKNETLQKYGVDSLHQLPINFDGIRMQADEQYGNQVWDKHFGNVRSIMTQQKQKYQLFGSLNPFISLQNTSMGFTATDNFHHQAFLVQAENYRRSFVKTLNDKQTFGGSKTGEWSWKVDNTFFKTVPDFKNQPSSLSSMFPHYRLDMLFLLAWSILVCLLLQFGARKMKAI